MSSTFVEVKHTGDVEVKKTKTKTHVSPSMDFHYFPLNTIPLFAAMILLKIILPCTKIQLIQQENYMLRGSTG